MYGYTYAEEVEVNAGFRELVAEVTDQFLRSKCQRTIVANEDKQYVIDFTEERGEYDDGTRYHVLSQVGSCYSEIQVPGDYAELVSLHTLAQMGMSGCNYHELARRYYYAILRELND